jgi:hypothetical protein
MNLKIHEQLKKCRNAIYLEDEECYIIYYDTEKLHIKKLKKLVEETLDLEWYNRESGFYFENCICIRIRPISNAIIN